MAGDGTSIVNFTFVSVHLGTGINMIYSPENIKLMNGKLVLFGGKQLKDNA